MEKVKVYFDPFGKTLTVWFGNPSDEYICEETEEEVIFMKDRFGNVIGFEKLNYNPEKPEEFQVEGQLVTAV